MKHLHVKGYVCFSLAVYAWSFLLQKCKEDSSHTEQSILQVFSLCLEGNDSQVFKCSSCEKLIPQCV